MPNNADENPFRALRPIIFWDGFPVCALLIKGVADKFGDGLVVVATRPQVPFSGLQEILGHDIVWLDDANDIWNHRDRFNDRNFVVHSAWGYKGWLKYDRLMKERNGAKVVVAVDNRFRGDLRQWLGAIWFRLRLKRYIDAALVPGKSGRKLMEFLGLSPERIYTGLYGAYEGIFKETTPIEDRPDEFLFVGQLNTRKSVDVLLKAFGDYRRTGGTWGLRMVGDGPLRDICRGDGIVLEPFAQPQEVAKKMNAAKALVLPSRDDNWGTVVCEAAACGMHIITTKAVAAGEDIVRKGVNGIIVENIAPSDLVKAFFEYEKMPREKLRAGSEASRAAAGQYGSKAYLETFLKMTADLGKNRT